MVKTVTVGNVKIGGNNQLVLIAGPCVIEGRALCMEIAERLSIFSAKNRIPFIFKASYDKANRSAHTSYRGPGLSEGLKILAEIKERYNLLILTDIHNESDVSPVAEVADMIQIPAFLCRQTDLVIAAAETNKPINVKKGQFMAPHDMENVINKILSTGNKKILLTERGASFGYNNLVADMRSLLILRSLGYPVVFDATHSVQRPGGAATASSGDGKWAPALARAAVATGCDAVFIETHITPAKALSDKDNCIAVSELRNLWPMLRKIDKIVR